MNLRCLEGKLPSSANVIARSKFKEASWISALLKFWGVSTHVILPVGGRWPTLSSSPAMAVFGIFALYSFAVGFSVASAPFKKKKKKKS